MHLQGVIYTTAQESSPITVNLRVFLKRRMKFYIVMNRKKQLDEANEIVRNIFAQRILIDFAIKTGKNKHVKHKINGKY